MMGHFSAVEKQKISQKEKYKQVIKNWYHMSNFYDMYKKH